MELIIGGAYQGKLEYARCKHHLDSADIYECGQEKVRLDAKCIYHLESYTLWCVKNNINPIEYFKNSKDKWENSIIICTDISCGIVPADSVARAWREQNGRLLNYLSGQAEKVVRMFCGIPQVIK